MADYVVRLTGKDELSGTLNKVKQELNQTGDAGSKLDQIRDRFNKITTSSAPLKKKLKEIQGIMAQMNLDGLNKSDVFTEMAAQAGAYKDAIGDAAQATRLLSSDTASLDALMEGLSAISSVASIATGTMGLFGTENKNVQQAILEVQSALGILSGVQTLSNQLNKDSILMLKLKEIWEARNVGITIADTAATTANTTSTVINTAANVASRVAQQAWNIAKAVGKALLGDFTGLLLVGAGALVTYALVTRNSANEQDNLNTSTKNVSNTFTNTYAQSLSQTMSKYEQLRNEYLNLKTEHQRIEWIHNNQSAFQNLGLSVNDVSSAENVFVNNTSRVVQALDQRAQAAAWAAIAQENYEKAFRARMQHQQLDKDVTTMRRNLSNQQARAAGNNTYHNTRNYKSTGKGAQHLQQIEDDNLRMAQEALKESAKLKSKEQSTLGKMATHKSSAPKSATRSTPKKNTTSSTKITSKQEVIPEGSIKSFEDKISKAQAKIKLSVDPQERIKLQKEIEGYKFEINKIKFNDATTTDGVDNVLRGTKVKLYDGVRNILKGTKAEIKDKIPKILSKDSTDTNGVKVPNITLPKTVKETNLEKNIKSIETLKDALSDLGGTFGEISTQWANLTELFEEGTNSSTLAGQGVTTLGQSLQAIGGDGAIAKVGAVMAAIGQIVLGFTTAANSPAVTSTGWGWLAFVGAGLATVATVISTLQSFSTGGIIQGGQIAGDQMLARVNAGEMILNGSQQKNLFNLLDSGGALAGSGNGNVEFRIAGSTLKGVLKNYDSKMNKIR